MVMGTKQLLTKCVFQGRNLSEAWLKYAYDRSQSFALILGNLLKITTFIVSDVNDKIGFVYYFTSCKLAKGHNEYKNKI